MRAPISRSADLSIDRRPVVVLVDDSDAIDASGIVRDGHSIRVPMSAITGSRSRPGPAVPATRGGRRLRIEDVSARKPIAPIGDGEIVEDGESVKVPMSAMDEAVYRHLYRQHPPRDGHAKFCGVVDVYGNEPGHRPGYVFAVPGSAVSRLRDETETERDKVTRQRANAWQGPVPAFLTEPAGPPARDPQIAVEPSNVSAGYVRAAPSARASTPAPETDADRARAERHRRDLSAWERP